MDLIKKLTGKNPSEYESVAKTLVENSDVELYKKLVEQDDFLFDFIKKNVAKRIQQACTKDNYLNILNFFKVYSLSYIDMFSEVLYFFGGNSVLPKLKMLLTKGTEEERANAIKCLSLYEYDNICDVISYIRELLKSENEDISINSAEFLGKFNDKESKELAIAKLKDNDEFEQYEAIKFLAAYGAKDSIKEIVNVMKKSGLSENIACEIPYIISLNELMESDYESCMLVLCNIISALPEIITPSAFCDYGFADLTECLINKLPDSIAALVLRMEKSKIEELLSNEEYLYDSDKNTKDEIKLIWDRLKNINTNMLTSLLYDELYDESDFVLYALDYADEVEELETLTKSQNPTVVLKSLLKLKEKGALKDTHKTYALNNFLNNDIRNVIEAL